MAGIYRGHLLEFPLIRVDCFTAARPEDVFLLPRPLVPEVTVPAPQARLFLLTHVHTDHLRGLDNKFTGVILCHPDTKRMLLRHEDISARRNLHEGKTELVKRKYTGFVRRRQTNSIETLPYGVPKEFDLGYYNGERCVVTITLLDANHCPGSTMFLITAKDKAVLHTGDVRADKLYMHQLMREPVLQEFLVPAYSPSTDPSPTRRLDRIYIDTSQSPDTQDMPQKENSLREMVYCMAQYPPDTVFFLNTWCWGWEEVIIAVAKAFRTKVHIDRYKRDVYQVMSTKMMDPFVTNDESVRFHACERYFRCDRCKGQRVVQVKMGEWNLAGSDILAAAFRSTLSQASAGEIEWPTEIVVPFARHSSLPELRNFTAHFQPRSLSLNTKLSNRQLYCFHEAFLGAVPDDAVLAIQAEARAWFAASPEHGRDWLMMMDLSPDLLDAADEPDPLPPPFLGLELNAGTTSNFDATNPNPDIGNPKSMVTALSGGFFGTLTRVRPFASTAQVRSAFSTVGLRSASSSSASSGPRTASSVGHVSVQARAVKREGEPKTATVPKEEVKPEMEIKVEPEAATPTVANSPKGVLSPSKGSRKRRRSERPASKYAVDAGSLSKLIKREPED